eukprot:TRINITY_DN6653_c0_g2_i1.p1 TRINITY_DN6653_c0_g2~~TRINITY_DN6653_c0_g2_i1.p1  ORF type:complete len:326 (-),score=39.83 TRINITY_DN6653_c0_g2_i1:26-952(-)
MGLKLCKGDYYELSEPNGLPQLIVFFGYLILIVFYVGTVFYTNRAIQSRSCRILIPIYTLLCLNLFLRCIKLPAGIHPLCYPETIYIICMNLIPLNKEIVLLCILIRFWRLLAIIEENGEVKYTAVFIPITKYGTIIYIAATLGMIIWKNFGLSEDYIYFYYGLEQVIIASVYAFATTKLFLEFPQNSRESGKCVKLFIAYLVLQLLIRLTYNLWLVPKLKDVLAPATLNLIIMALTDTPFYIIIPLVLLSKDAFMDFLLKGNDLVVDKDEVLSEDCLLSVSGNSFGVEGKVLCKETNAVVAAHYYLV